MQGGQHDLRMESCEYDLNHYGIEKKVLVQVWAKFPSQRGEPFN